MNSSVNEKLLHYIWQYQLFNKTCLESSIGEPIQILSHGCLNHNQGPDFLNAKIKIEDTIWVGNIEIHVNTSDWEKHKHSGDDHYKNVILHVVWNDDKNLNLPFPTIELKSKVAKLLIQKYKLLMESKTFIPCQNNIKIVDDLNIEKCKERLLIERLQEKSIFIESLLIESNNNWNEIIWWVMAKSFGGKINGEAFETIAKNIPLGILLQNRHSLFQIEAIIFGQSGLLNDEFTEEYPNKLKLEYAYLQKKYGFKAPTIRLNYLRMRPANFPAIRLAQLSSFVFLQGHLFSNLFHFKEKKEVNQFFEIFASSFWNNHYTFHQLSTNSIKKIGLDTSNSIHINALIPLMYCYGYYYNNEAIKMRAIEWLYQIRNENNSIITAFSKLNVSIKSAADSQAMIQLYTKYCQQKRCLHCTIGNVLFTKN